MKKTCSTLLLLALTAAAADNPVAWSARGPGKAVKRSGRFKLFVEAKIEPGWHLYSMEQPGGGPIPARIWLPEDQPFQLSGKIKGPKPRTVYDTNFNMNVEYFEQSATFVLPVKVTAGAPAGARTLLVNASSQSCNDKLCLPPRTVKLEVSVEVK